MPIGDLPPRRRNAGDLVLANDGVDWVDTTITTDGRVQLGLFLQLHGANEKGLPAGEALVRFAYRNYQPEAVMFRRTLRCTDGDLGMYDAKKDLTIPSARRKGDRGVTGVIEDSVKAERGPTGARVIAQITAVRPRSSFKNARTQLSVAFPEPGKEARCSCCLRRYRT
jgi:hypothetical protein